MEWRGGDVAGTLPYSRMRGSPGETHVLEPTELLGLGRSHFRDLARDCHELTAILVHVMLDRARHFRSSDLHEEKLASLGRLAAGLAHELNNPASAVARNAAALVERLPDTEAAFRTLGGIRLSPAELEVYLELRDRCLAAGEIGLRSPLDQAERIEALGDWLEQHGLERSVAEALAETELDLERLEAAATVLPGEALVAALGALAAGCGTRRLAHDIERAASRVHELVAAVKGFTYMDQARTPKPVDLARGLADTLTVLRAKAKARSVQLRSEVEPGLPAIVGFGGELNQVWANLIDNAIDAAPVGGHVEVSAARSGSGVVIRIVDDGPGVPDEVRERIFEPFFTTKPVGEGTGLGLVIARSLVRQHLGEIEIESRAGRTELRVILPGVPAPPAPGATPSEGASA
jgi:signal transduction histidine kinase